MKTGAATVEAYLAGLPEDRRKALEAVREVVLANLPAGYQETMNWGMISYEVPLSITSKTYNGKPLSYAGLASQKNHMAVYLHGLYCVKGALEAFKKNWTGGKLDMGAACVRFKKLESLDLGSIGAAIAATPLADFVTASKR